MITVENVSKQYGARPLFERLSFTVNEGDHVGLVGPNGSGKSTLLKILAGIEQPDSGSRAVRKRLRIGYVPQDPVFAPGKTIEQVLEEVLGEPDVARIAQALGKAGFTDRTLLTDTLSGGWRKRLAIARELVGEPDLLLLDEPTNHLDLEAILWLETMLKNEPEAFVVVSHDRYFLENVARRMIELNRVYPDGLLQVDGTYSVFLERRDELLRNEAAYQESLANIVRREIEWLRRGPKARTTKAKARIQNAASLIGELEEGRDRARVSTARIDFASSERKTKRLLVAEGIGKRGLFEDLDIILRPGTRLGIVGPNGSGKTTLLRVLIGELEPDKGTIERADRLRIVYFEQNRESLDPTLTLKRALAPEGDAVVYQDRSIHVASWAKRFLFRPEQLETSVSKLSGGEKARIVLARLMLRPADLLVLDEPTNDLDIPTLEVLEESLLEFPGAIVLVTHDRYLLDRVSTDTVTLAADEKPASRSEPDKRQRKPRLGYLEQREYDALEETLRAAETRLAEAAAAVEDPSIATDSAALQQRYSALAEAQAEVDRLYERWLQLAEKA
ncbi:MAG TPA: ABC-F family ATP-binding cassette domain-containing protein [Thermoanaerobaculia bacterium]|nr:ABC-F family ATP-binding cassette domain-containing protein [Thermoanaerobaculia bacterium]